MADDKAVKCSECGAEYRGNVCLAKHQLQAHGRAIVVESLVSEAQDVILALLLDAESRQKITGYEYHGIVCGVNVPDDLGLLKAIGKGRLIGDPFGV